MGLLTTVLGIGLALLAALAGRPWAAFVALYALLVGVAAVVVGSAIGASGPRVASGAFRLGALIPLSLGAIAGAVGIWLVAVVIEAQGTTPTPWASALGAAAGAALATLIQKLQGLDGLMPSALAQRLVHWRYQHRFPSLDALPSAAFVDAYKAIYIDPFQRPERPPIKGWGFDATARRLALIHAGLVVAGPTPPVVPAPPAPPAATLPPPGL